MSTEPHLGAEAIAVIRAGGNNLQNAVMSFTEKDIDTTIDLTDDRLLHEEYTQAVLALAMRFGGQAVHVSNVVQTFVDTKKTAAEQIGSGADRQQVIDLIAQERISALQPRTALV